MKRLAVTIVLFFSLYGSTWCTQTDFLRRHESRRIRILLKQLLPRNEQDSENFASPTTSTQASPTSTAPFSPQEAVQILLDEIFTDINTTKPLITHLCHALETPHEGLSQKLKQRIATYVARIQPLLSMIDTKLRALENQESLYWTTIYGDLSTYPKGIKDLNQLLTTQNECKQDYEDFMKIITAGQVFLEKNKA